MEDETKENAPNMFAVVRAMGIARKLKLSANKKSIDKSDLEMTNLSNVSKGTSSGTGTPTRSIKSLRGILSGTSSRSRKKSKGTPKLGTPTDSFSSSDDERSVTPHDAPPKKRPNIGSRKPSNNLQLHPHKSNPNLSSLFNMNENDTPISTRKRRIIPPEEDKRRKSNEPKLKTRPRYKNKHISKTN
jgi:hypothetical protein